MFTLEVYELDQEEGSLTHDGKDEIILIFSLEFFFFRLEMVAIVLNHLFGIWIFVAISED